MHLLLATVLLAMGVLVTIIVFAVTENQCEDNEAREFKLPPSLPCDLARVHVWNMTKYSKAEMVQVSKCTSRVLSNLCLY